MQDRMQRFKTIHGSVFRISCSKPLKLLRVFLYIKKTLLLFYFIVFFLLRVVVFFSVYLFFFFIILRCFFSLWFVPCEWVCRGGRSWCAPNTRTQTQTRRKYVKIISIHKIHWWLKKIGNLSHFKRYLYFGMK